MLFHAIISNVRASAGRERTAFVLALTHLWWNVKKTWKFSWWPPMYYKLHQIYHRLTQEESSQSGSVEAQGTYLFQIKKILCLLCVCKLTLEKHRFQNICKKLSRHVQVFHMLHIVFPCSSRLSWELIIIVHELIQSSYRNYR